MDFGNGTSNGNGGNMGTQGTSIWDLIVLMILGRMFGFGTGNEAGQAALTRDSVESTVRNAMDNQGINTRLDNIAANAASCCCDQKLGMKDLEISNLVQTNAFQIQLAAMQANSDQHFSDLEIRNLTQRLTAAETALNNCNQTAAVSAIVGNAINPVANALGALAQQVNTIVNCGVKANVMTPSVPAFFPPATPYAPIMPFNGGCDPGNNGGFNNNFNGAY